MENYRYNFWFNELQVYKCSYLPGFFEWLDGFPKEKYLNEWACFEYYIFFAYLCLEHDFHLTKYGQFVSLGGINECLKLPSRFCGQQSGQSRGFSGAADENLTACSEKVSVLSLPAKSHITVKEGITCQSYHPKTLKSYATAQRTLWLRQY
ncbi:MAG: hypothetical protein IJT02_07070 [Synergistaceae bacterium]|nr:hypothetical protein [Synergistaceae bacterium]